MKKGESHKSENQKPVNQNTENTKVDVKKPAAVKQESQKGAKLKSSLEVKAKAPKVSSEGVLSTSVQTANNNQGLKAGEKSSLALVNSKNVTQTTPESEIQSVLKSTTSSTISSKEKTMNYSAFEIPSFVREAAEKSVNESKKAYENLKSTAEKSTAALQQAYEETSKGYINLALELVGYSQKQTEANFAFLKDLISSKNPAEIVEKTNAFTQENVKTAMENSKELQSKIVALANDTSKPIKDIVEKVTKAA